MNEEKEFLIMQKMHNSPIFKEIIKKGDEELASGEDPYKTLLKTQQRVVASYNQILGKENRKGDTIGADEIVPIFIIILANLNLRAFHLKDLEIRGDEIQRHPEQALGKEGLQFSKIEGAIEWIEKFDPLKEEIILLQNNINKMEAIQIEAKSIQKGQRKMIAFLTEPAEKTDKTDIFMQKVHQNPKIQELILEANRNIAAGMDAYEELNKIINKINSNPSEFFTNINIIGGDELLPLTAVILANLKWEENDQLKMSAKDNFYMKFEDLGLAEEGYRFANILTAINIVKSYASPNQT